MKKVLILFIMAILVCTFSICTFAEDGMQETVVYVKKGATGGDGSFDSPYGSLVGGAKGIGDGKGTVVIIGEYAISSASILSDFAGDATFVAGEGGCITLSANFALAESKYDNTITFDLPFKLTGAKTYILFGGFNNVVFGENFSVEAPDGALLDFYGGVRSNDDEGICEHPYSITVNNGTFNVFSGGNLRAEINYYLGAIAAPISITINGGTFGQHGTFSSSNNKNYDTFSVSGMSLLADDATLTVNGGTFNYPIYVQGRTDTIQSVVSEKCTKLASDKKYYALDGDVKVNITGGTFNGGMIGAYYTQAAYTTVMRGNFDVNISGGTFTSGTVIDATQVKGYAGTDTKATITYSDENITPVRFDVVNGKANTYEEPIRVSFIGASITEGYAPSGAKVVRLTDSFPAKFLEYAEADGREVIIGNFGVGSGGYLPSTSRYYLDMLAWPMVSEESDPDYVFFQMGTNDASGVGGTNGGAMLFKKNYKDMVVTMGELPDTDKVFMTRSFYRSTSSKITDLRAAACVRPIQDEVAEELAWVDADKYISVDLYGLTYDDAVSDALFTADDGKVYERLHPARNGLAILGRHCYNAAFNGIYAPEKYTLTDIYISDNGNAVGKGTKNDPISDITVAYALMERGSEVTLHIVDTFTFSGRVNLPYGLKKLTIVGEGENAVLTCGGLAFKLGSDTKIDNITLKTTDSYTTFVGAYNDVEITSSVKTEGAWHFYAGHNVYGAVDPATTATFDTVESASSDADCTIVINGGKYGNMAFGNRRFAADAPFGTYSGTMNVTVGKGITMSGSGSNTYIGINGHNYLTGTINATLNSWSGDIDTFVRFGSIESPIVYDRFVNTGTVNVTKSSSLTNSVNVIYDFNADGAATLKDAFQALKYCVNGFDTSKSANLYGENNILLRDVLRILNGLTK